MKKIAVLILVFCMILPLSSCGLTDKIKSEVGKAAASAVSGAGIDLNKLDNSGKPGIEAPEGSPDWCGQSNVQKIIKKYLGGDASNSYRVSELLGLNSYKDKSYGSAKIENWIYTMEGSHGDYYATIYFNEDGSDVWIRIDPYETVGTEQHYVDGKLVEEIDISTGKTVKEKE